MSDTSVFPDPIYRDTVLAPLFEGVKAHYARHMDSINRAHLVMLVETGILTRGLGAQIAAALDAIGKQTDVAALSYTGEHEDYFFLVEAELRRRLGDPGGALRLLRVHIRAERADFMGKFGDLLIGRQGRAVSAGRTGRKAKNSEKREKT